MKLLLTSDLHRDAKKLSWILENAPAHDAVLIAGDMLDIFFNTAMRMQIEGAHLYRDAQLAEDRWLVWCSGNHDFYLGENTPMDEGSPAWMREGEAEKFVRDGETRQIGNGADSVIVTTVPWPVPGNKIVVQGAKISYLDQVKSLLHEGHRLREKLARPWILLHHEPPIETAISAGYDMAEAAFSRRLLEAAGPDFSIHGHIHEAPHRTGGSWNDVVGRTVCFNAGQSAPGELPHAVLLTVEGVGKWRAEWISEGRIQDVR
jgi:Icc-related predicted phosphoesterase